MHIFLVGCRSSVKMPSVLGSIPGHSKTYHNSVAVAEKKIKPVKRERTVMLQAHSQ